MTTARPWLPYVLPFGLYMLFLLVQTTENLLWLYPLKTAVVAGALWYFRKAYTELGWPRTSSVLWGAVIGLVAIVIWIAIDPYYPGLGQLMAGLHRFLNSLFGITTATKPAPPPFDPTTLADPVMRSGFIVSRIFGAVVVVAFMEEIFWRGFVMRWLIKEDFQSVPVGAFTWPSFWFTVLLFGAEHDQWLAGLICGALYNGLLYRTKNLTACVIAHAVSNAVLAAYVLHTGDWKFW